MKSNLEEPVYKIINSSKSIRQARMFFPYTYSIGPNFQMI